MQYDTTLLTQCLRSPITCFWRPNITFYAIKRQVHVILSVRIVYQWLRHPK